jgi:hypothetical protein
MSQAATICAQRQSDPVRLSRLFRGELDWIVMKALEKDRSRRYETAYAFARDIQRYLADEPVEASPPSVRYRLRKFARKNRAALTSAAVILLLLLAGVAASTWQAIRATRAEEDAVLATDLAGKDRDRALRSEAVAKEQRDLALKAERRAKEQSDKATAMQRRADHQAAIA